MNGRANNGADWASMARCLPVTPQANCRIGQRQPRGMPQRSLLVALVTCLLTGCTQEMTDQPRLEPLEASRFFDDRQSARKPVVGTVSRGHQRPYTGVDSMYLRYGRATDRGAGSELPEAIIEQYDMWELLTLGQEHYNAYCIYCHDMTGTGNGIVPQRGFPYPPSFHVEPLRELPVNVIFQVISEGKGRMQPYAAQIPVEHRWAIAAYVKTLQLSRYVDVTELSEQDRTSLQAAIGDEAAETNSQPAQQAEE